MSSAWRLKLQAVAAKKVSKCESLSLALSLSVSQIPTTSSELSELSDTFLAYKGKYFNTLDA